MSDAQLLEAANEVRRVMGDPVLLDEVRRVPERDIVDVCDSLKARAPVDYPREAIRIAIALAVQRSATRRLFG